MPHLKIDYYNIHIICLLICFFANCIRDPLQAEVIELPLSFGEMLSSYRAGSLVESLLLLIF